MKVKPQPFGVQKTTRRFARVRGALVRIPRVRVYPKGRYSKSVHGIQATGTSLELVAMAHADPQPRKGGWSLPARNPWFLDEQARRGAVKSAQRGVLEIWQGRSSGMRQRMSDIGKQTVRHVQRNFERGRHSPLGKGGKNVTSMAPLNPDYKAWKRKYSFSTKRMIRTGQMKASVTFELVT